MDLKIDNCPICGNSERELLLDFEGSLQFIHNEYNKFLLKKFQCSDCFHVYTAYIENYALEDHYESTRDSAQELIYSSNAQESINVFDNLVDWAMEGFDKLSFPYILDIGCGKSDLLQSFSRKVTSSNLYGIDYSPKAKMFGEANGLNNIISGNFYNENFDDNKFNLITATGLMEHQPNLSLFVEKIISLMEPNGYLLIEVPDSFSILTGRPDLKAKSAHDICNDEHLHHFNENSLIKIFNEYGFSVVRKRKISRGIWDVIDVLFCYTNNKEDLEYLPNKNNDVKNIFLNMKNINNINLNNIIKKHGSLSIYGAGWHTCKVLLSYYNFDFSFVNKIFDKDSRKIGKKIYGIEIVEPNKSSLAGEIILISSINMNSSIVKYLSDKGVSKNNIINIYPD
ncbi:class I SAM-dependent methyltransferase [Candidatus Pseudothioglobus singularis]|nr:class I SAM-dependent methyltransferase [Candidatus Pseudothioglobus singularis]